MCNNNKIIFLYLILCLCGCKDDPLPFPESEPIDPYCKDIDQWGDEIAANVEFVEDSEAGDISVGFETKHDAVTMSGQVHVTGGSAGLIIHDPPDLWLVITPSEGAERIEVEGAVQCAPKESSVRLTIRLDKASESLSFNMSFDGVEYDAGVREDGGAPADAE